MSMTLEERKAKKYLWEHLRKEGYPTYAKIFYNFDFHFTDNPNAVGFLDNKDGSITLNRELDVESCSVVIRHEILHAYLQHHKRMIAHLAKQRGLDPDKLDDLSLNELLRDIYMDPDRLDNIAGDYEISNRGYTRKDKAAVRRILINGRTVSGLVTEDDHPDWTDLSIEEMYDKLNEIRQTRVTRGFLLDDTTFVAPDGTVYGIGDMPKTVSKF